MALYKKSGWYGENYRHFLSAKGIKTKRYLVRNEFKGNRDSGYLKSQYAKGFSKEEALAKLGIETTKTQEEPILNKPYEESIPSIEEPSQQIISNNNTSEQNMASNEQIKIAEGTPNSTLLPQSKEKTLTRGVPDAFFNIEVQQ